jgi:hypothetical protein
MMGKRAPRKMSEVAAWSPTPSRMMATGIQAKNLEDRIHDVVGCGIPT